MRAIVPWLLLAACGTSSTAPTPAAAPITEGAPRSLIGILRDAKGGPMLVTDDGASVWLELGDGVPSLDDLDGKRVVIDGVMHRRGADCAPPPAVQEQMICGVHWVLAVEHVHVRAR